MTDMDNLENAVHKMLAENTRLKAVNAELLAALERAFSLIKNSGFRSGLEEAEFDATLFQVGNALANANT